MEGETKTLIIVSTAVVTSLCYVHKISKIFQKDFSKKLSIFPVICLFFFLPLKFKTATFGSTSTFLISWLANFKLMLFAFDKGPLHSSPPIPLSHFIALACFPIKTGENNEEEKKTLKSPLNYLSKITLLLALMRSYEFKEHFPPKITLLCYCVHVYLNLEIFLGLFAYVAKALAELEIESPFEEPYLATSLQDFWGRKWNLITTRILHLSVYEPLRSSLVGSTGPDLARVSAVLAAFFVSGLMHELVVYNVGRSWPTGEMLCFFLLHGASLCLEITVNKMLQGRFRVPKIASRVLTVGYVVLTSFWLFFPPFIRAGLDVKGCKEILALVESVKSRRLVDPRDVSCPFY